MEFSSLVLSIWSSVCFLYWYSCVWGGFLLWSCWTYFPLIYAYISKAWVFSWCPTFPVGCFSGFCLCFNFSYTWYGVFCLMHLTCQAFLSLQLSGLGYLIASSVSAWVLSVSLVNSIPNPWVALAIPSAFCCGFFGNNSDIYSPWAVLFFSP